jgi:alpha-glucosidase (family GH31 glycosyl hydrolase)
MWQTDFGERIPHADVVFHDGSDPMRIHNTYSVIYTELVFDLLKKRFGVGEAVVFARSSTVGGQRFPVVNMLPVLYVRRLTLETAALGR